MLNDRIKKRRLELGLTLAQVADLLGVKEATAQRYESGKIKNIKHETILNLSKILKCEPSYLMGWDDTYDNYISSLGEKVDKGLPLNSDENKTYLEYINDDGSNENPPVLKIISSDTDLKILELFSSLPDDKLEQAMDYLRFLSQSDSDNK